MTPITAGLLGTIVGALIGSIIGHRFSLGRDKRREYNEATFELRKAAVKSMESLSITHPGIKYINDEDILTLRAKVGDSSSEKIARAYEKYAAAYDASISTSLPSSPINPQPIQTEKVPECEVALKLLIACLEPK